MMNQRMGKGEVEVYGVGVVEEEEEGGEVGDSEVEEGIRNRVADGGS